VEPQDQPVAGRIGILPARAIASSRSDRSGRSSAVAENVVGLDRVGYASVVRAASRAVTIGDMAATSTGRRADEPAVAAEYRPAGTAAGMVVGAGHRRAAAVVTGTGHEGELRLEPLGIVVLRIGNG
jgi:hypothetical protein